MSRVARPAHLPLRDGVSASCVALPAGPWSTVLDFLAQRLPRVSRDEWAERIAQGAVVWASGEPLAPHAPYPAARPGLRLFYWRQLPQEPVVPFEETVLFHDAHLVVADKPHFLPVTPTGRFVQQTLLTRLKRRLGIETLSPIHRIDRETAGLVVFSVRPQDRGAYQALFRDRAVQKTYEAVALFDASKMPLRHVKGSFHAIKSIENLPCLTYRSRMVQDPQHFFRMTEVPGPPNSQTDIQCVQQHGGHALYRLHPVTGKRHQLRVHMAALGLPIVGDQFYPHILRGPDAPEDFAQPLQLLARQIAFDDPLSGQRRCFESSRSLLF